MVRIFHIIAKPDGLMIVETVGDNEDKLSAVRHKVEEAVSKSN